MPPHLRPATPADATFAAPLIQATIGAIGRALTGEATDEGAGRVIAALFGQPRHRLSFQNTLILEEGNGERVGLAVLYPGDHANRLDGPLRVRLRTLGLPERIDPEATPGELYLDTLAITPGARGRGLGGVLVEGCAARAAALNLPLGLLVEEGNPAARLYARHGFGPVGTRVVSGHRYTHLRRGTVPGR